jgi:hypothetical protein
MSLEITYLSDDKKYKWRLSVSEVEAMEILASKGLKDKADTILDVVDFGEKTCIAKSQLFEAVVFLINELENNPDLTPYFFDVKAETPRGSGNYSRGGTGISGMKIKGEEYVIWYGLDKCVLMKKWQDADMKIHHGEPVDIRHLSTIETDKDSFIGDIKISKRKMSNVLVKNLKKLKIFLEGCPDDDIIKILG